MKRNFYKYLSDKNEYTNIHKKYNCLFSVDVDSDRKETGTNFEYSEHTQR